MKRIKSFVSLALCFCLIFGFSVLTGAETVKKDELSLDCKGAVLMDMRSGEVLYSKDENEKVSPASITKVMSLILVMEQLESGKISLKDEVSASKTAVSMGGSQIWLKEGEKMSVDEMLKAVVVSSANDACTALGEFVAGSSEGFVSLMNKKAKELGMKNTNFENCTGLDDEAENHYSTALDVALMSRELMKYDLIKNYTTIWMDSLRNGETMLVNTNKLVRSYDGCIGLKTGTTTKAGFCVTAVAEREGTRLCSVILGAKTGDERFEQAAKLLNFGFANFETASPEVDLSQSGEVKVRRGMKTDAEIALAEPNPSFTTEKGKKDEIKTKISLKNSVEAPLSKGEVLGRAEFYLDNKLIGSVDIVNTEEIERLSFFEAFKRLLSSLVNSDLSA